MGSFASHSVNFSGLGKFVSTFLASIRHFFFRKTSSLSSPSSSFSPSSSSLSLVPTAAYLHKTGQLIKHTSLDSLSAVFK